MALRVWLPLNGTLENKGISDVTVTSNGATVNNNGKIGKCYSFNGSSNYLYTTYNFYNLTYSISAWIYTTSSSVTQTIICDRTAVGSGFSTFLIGGKLRIDAGGNSLQWETNYTYPVNTWFHLTITYDGTNVCYYINGEFKETKAQVINSSYWGSVTSIGASQQNGSGYGNYLNGHLNDIRIYNHCLSAKEVKEISQGLVLHYRLDGWSGGAGENLLANSMPLNSLNGWSHAGTNWSNSIVDCDITSSGKCVRCTYTGTTQVSGGIHHPPIDWNSMEDGEVYTLSAYIRASKSCTITFKNEMMSSASSGTFTPTITQSWQRYEVSGPINKAATYHSNIMYVVTSEAEQNMWIEACMMKLEKGSTSTSWTLTPSEFGVDTTKITDSSGYGNDGTITGTLSTESDYNRYEISSKFNDSRITTTANLTIHINDSTATLAAWVNLNSYHASERCMIIYSNGLYLTVTNSGKVSIYAYGKSPAGYHDSTNTIPLNTWTHLAVVWTASSALIYINGVLDKTISCSGAFTGLGDYRYQSIGQELNGNRSVTGNISDARIYSTALSADDILDLYHTSANIDNLGNLHGFEFCESNNTSTMIDLYNWGTKVDDVTWTINKTAAWDGFYISSNNFTPDNTYRITFYVKKNSGTLNYIAGHSAGFTSLCYFVDGKKCYTAWGNSSEHVQSVDDDLFHRYDVYVTYLGESDNNNFYIQPNRGNTTAANITVSCVSIENINNKYMLDKNKVKIHNNGIIKSMSCEESNTKTSIFENSLIGSTYFIEK